MMKVAESHLQAWNRLPMCSKNSQTFQGVEFRELESCNRRASPDIFDENMCFSMFPRIYCAGRDTGRRRYTPLRCLPSVTLGSSDICREGRAVPHTAGPSGTRDILPLEEGGRSIVSF